MHAFFITMFFSSLIIASLGPLQLGFKTFVCTQDWNAPRISGVPIETLQPVLACLSGVLP